MGRASIWQKKFDPNARFTVAREFRASGQLYVPGDVVDKSLFRVRKLRMLYDQRKITQDSSVIELPEQEPVTVETIDLTNQQDDASDDSTEADSSRASEEGEVTIERFGSAYALVRNGEKISKLMSKANAEKALAEQA